MIKKILLFLVEFLLGNKFANNFFSVKRSLYGEFNNPIWRKISSK